MAAATPSGGVLATLRALLAALLEIGALRLELLGAELELERRRLFDALLLATLAVLLLALGLLALCGFAILLLWDSYRLGAVAAMALLLLGLGAFVLLRARRQLRSGHGIFSASLAEFRRAEPGRRGADTGV